MSGVLLVLSDPVEGREEEYNTWYDTVHLPEILRHPAFVSARRYRAPDAMPSSSGHRYLAVYVVTDTAAAAAELAAASLTPSAALAANHVVQGFFDERPQPGE